MSLKKNILANYASQIYVSLIGIIMVPLYVKYLGLESYGLVAFFAMMQAWFQLLDVGLTATMARETARFNGGAIDALTIRRLLRTLEGIFIFIAILAAVIMISLSGKIAQQWLNVQHLSLLEVEHAISLMALVIVLRWIDGLYRGVIVGLEQMIWLSSFNSFIASLRFILVIPFLMYISTRPSGFFSFQLGVCVIETLLLIYKTYSLLPKIHKQIRLKWQWQPLSNTIKFSLSIAFTSAIWVLITQTDKLILTKLLSLSDYAIFALGVLVASSILIISGPISIALLPRMTKLSANKSDHELIKLYRNTTQLVAVLVLPPTLLLTFFSQQILFLWTNNSIISAAAAPVLSLYAAGNGLLTLSAFPYYLQFAKGDLKLHVIGNAIFLLTLIPAIIWNTYYHGMLGAGIVWLSMNFLYFLLWVPKVHRRFVPGLANQWLLQDVLPIAGFSLVGILSIHSLFTLSKDRWEIAVGCTLIGLTLLIISSCSSSWLRALFLDRWQARFNKLPDNL